MFKNKNNTNGDRRNKNKSICRWQDTLIEKAKKKKTVYQIIRHNFRIPHLCVTCRC